MLRLVGLVHFIRKRLRAYYRWATSLTGILISAAFYYLSLAILTAMFAVCALRTNLVFFSALFTLIFAFACGAGAFWNLAEGNDVAGARLTVVCFTLSTGDCGSRDLTEWQYRQAGLSRSR